VAIDQNCVGVQGVGLYIVLLNIPTQRPLPDNIHFSQETDTNAPAGFEPKIPASERPQTHALDRGATGIGWKLIIYGLFNDTVNSSACVASDLRNDSE
jgi:hypothetical protein